MKPDPVVEEVRRAGEAVVEESGGDLRRLFDRLRENERKHRPDRIIRQPLPQVLAHREPS